MKTYTVAHDKVEEGISIVNDNKGAILFLGQKVNGRVSKVTLDKFYPAKIKKNKIFRAFLRDIEVKDKTTNKPLYNYLVLSKPNKYVCKAMVRINTSSPDPIPGYWRTIFGSIDMEKKVSGYGFDIIPKIDTEKRIYWQDDLIITDPGCIIQVGRGKNIIYIRNFSGSLRQISKKEVDSFIVKPIINSN